MSSKALEQMFGVPSECPNCGGPVDYATEQVDGAQILLCRGECGEWSVIADE